MSRTDSLPQSANSWSLRDLLLIGGAVVLFGLATMALARRDEIVQRLPGGPQVIATLRTADFHALTFAPDDSNVIYFGHHNGIMKSENGGAVWTPVLNRGDAMSLAVLPDSPEVVIAAGHLVFLRSPDRGATWQPFTNDLPYTDIHGFAINPSDTHEWFAFVVGFGLYRSNDSGAHWVKVSGNLPETTMGLLVVPGTKSTLYAGTMDRGVLVSQDGGNSWTSANFERKMVMTLTQDPRDPQIVFAGSDVGLFRLKGPGARWERIGLAGKNLMAVAASRGADARMIAVDEKGRVYRSQDGGRTW